MFIPFSYLDTVSWSLSSAHFTPHSPTKGTVIEEKEPVVSHQPYPLPLENQLVQEAGILCLTFYQERVSKPCLDCMKEFNSVFVEKGQLAKVILADLSQPCQM